MKNNHNLFVICSFICIALFVYIPIHIWIFKEYRWESKTLMTLASALIELFLIDELIKAIKDNNKI